MGQLIEGCWSADRPLSDARGRFVRRPSSFRRFVSRDDAAPGRYHLYACWACPWAHRTLIVRKLRNLEDVVSLAVSEAIFTDQGWRFDAEPGSVPDAAGGFCYLHEAYSAADPTYTGRVTVPVLWDRRERTIVNNESREIIRMFDTAFLDLGDPSVCFRPEGLAARIDEAIDDLFQPINNGVYRAGFARTQEAYDEAVAILFDALERYEALLGRQRYVCGNVVTEADWCLFTTLVRFDLVYHYHFKCNVKRLTDFPNLWAYARELYQVPGVRETCNFDHIKRHYYSSHHSVNPTGIVPKGPVVDFDEPHDRAAKLPV